MLNLDSTAQSPARFCSDGERASAVGAGARPLRQSWVRRPVPLAKENSPSDRAHRCIPLPAKARRSASWLLVLISATVQRCAPTSAGARRRKLVGASPTAPRRGGLQPVGMLAASVHGECSHCSSSSTGSPAGAVAVPGSDRSRLRRRGAAGVERRQQLHEVVQHRGVLDRRRHAPALAVGDLADRGAQRLP